MPSRSFRFAALACRRGPWAYISVFVYESLCGALLVSVEIEPLRNYSIHARLYLLHYADAFIPCFDPLPDFLRDVLCHGIYFTLVFVARPLSVG